MACSTAHLDSSSIAFILTYVSFLLHHDLLEWIGLTEVIVVIGTIIVSWDDIHHVTRVDEVHPLCDILRQNCESIGADE